MAKIITTTTNSIEGWDIKEYLQPISTNVVVGANIFSDLTASLTDFFGGRSGSYERRLNEIYDHAIKNLIDKARAVGANSIVGLKIDFGEVTGKGTQMFMISAVGTPVKAIRKDGSQIDIVNGDTNITFDGELVEKKIKATRLIDTLSAGDPQIERISEDSVNFIVESKLPEFAPIVLMILDKWSYFTESLGKLKVLTNYFGNIDRDVAVSAIYRFVEDCDLGDDSRSRFVKMVVGFDQIDYGRLEPLFHKGSAGAKKFALDILAIGKTFYTKDDVVFLRQFVEIIPEVFKPLGTTEQVKGMFSSSPKSVWFCECGTKNGDSATYCSRCGYDNYGFKEGDNKPDKVADLIKKRLAVIDTL